jgi:hypothetical protein
MKAPSSKLQAPKKLQIPSSNTAGSPFVLAFGAWNFSGAWSLELGISSGRVEYE